MLLTALGLHPRPDHKAEVGVEDLSVVRIPPPKKPGSGPHTALADLAFGGNTPLLVVRQPKGDCITIPSGAITSVWPFPDALRIDPDLRVAIELQDRAPLGPLCETLAAAGIAGLVTAAPLSLKASVSVRVEDFRKVVAFLPDLGIELGATDRLVVDPGSGDPSKGTSPALPSHLASHDSKSAADGVTKRASSSSSSSRSSEKRSKKQKKSASRSRSRSRRKFTEKAKDTEKSRDKSREKRKSRDRDRDRDKSRDKDKDKKKDRDRDKRKDRSKSRDKKRSRSRDRDKDRDKNKDKDRDRDRDKDKDRDKEKDKSKKDSKDNGKASPARAIPKRSKPPRGGFDQKEAQMSSSLALVASGMGLLPGMPNMSLTADPEVEAFLAINPVDQQAASRFRALPLELQRLVLVRGSLVGTRDPSAVLMSRVRDAMSGSGSIGGMTMGAAHQQPNPHGPMGPPTAGSNPQVEAFLSENPVDFQAATRLRALPPHLQRIVLIRGGLSSTRDPSSVLMSRIRDAMGQGNGKTGVVPMMGTGMVQ